MTSADMASAGNELHLQYQTKSLTDANTAACQPSSVMIPVTPNDIVTFDTAGILGYPLFGDSTNPAPTGTSISYPAPRHGFLWIGANYQQANHAGYINGATWIELDLANGGAHGDAAPLAFQTNVSRNNGGDWFTNKWVVELGQYNATPVQLFPSSVASQFFTVTPLGSDMLNRENNQTIVQIINHSDVQGAYDRNENGVDGTVPVTVRCVGRVTPAQLMPGVVANAAWAAQGGFGYLANLGDGDGDFYESQGGTNSGDLDAMVYQIDQTTAGGKFMSNATRIVSSLAGHSQGM